MKVYGSLEELQEFKVNNKSLITNECLSFSRIISELPDVNNYEYNAYNSSFIELYTNLEYKFDTVRSPPFVWLNKCAKKYPNLNIDIIILEQEWFGKYEIKNGELFEIESYATIEDYLIDYINEHNITIDDLLKYGIENTMTYEAFEHYPNVNLDNNIYDITAGCLISLVNSYLQKLEPYVIIIQSKFRQILAKKRYLKKNIEKELHYLPPKNKFPGGIKYQELKLHFDNYKN